MAAYLHCGRSVRSTPYETVHPTDMLKAVFTLIILAYYFVSIRNQPQICKMMAIFALEITGVLVWLATCSSLVAVYFVLLSYDAIERLTSTLRTGAMSTITVMAMTAVATCWSSWREMLTLHLVWY